MNIVAKLIELILVYAAAQIVIKLFIDYMGDCDKEMQTVKENPDHYIFCIDCNKVRQVNDHGGCSLCQSGSTLLVKM